MGVDHATQGTAVPEWVSEFLRDADTSNLPPVPPANVPVTNSTRGKNEVSQGRQVICQATGRPKNYIPFRQARLGQRGAEKELVAKVTMPACVIAFSNLDHSVYPR